MKKRVLSSAVCASYGGRHAARQRYGRRELAPAPVFQTNLKGAGSNALQRQFHSRFPSIQITKDEASYTKDTLR